MLMPDDDREALLPHFSSLALSLSICWRPVLICGLLRVLLLLLHAEVKVGGREQGEP